jgi:SAM-dependent methyltransferase
MGKSNPIVFNFYLKNLNTFYYKDVALFGQDKDNEFTKLIKSENKDFFDLSLGNWNINNYPYKHDKKYDLVLCTRCAYFSKNPEKTLNEFYNILNPGGTIFIDWGLGDHWRFNNYKIGWLKNSEHEYAYCKDNFLWSTVWHDSLLGNSEYKLFEKWTKSFNYLNVKQAIFDEVPSVLDITKFDNVEIDVKALWPNSPQLYILCKFKKDIF